MSSQRAGLVRSEWFKCRVQENKINILILWVHACLSTQSSFQISRSSVWGYRGTRGFSFWARILLRVINSMKIQTATWQGLRALASAPVRLSLILGSREKGGNAKGMYHSGNRRREEGHIQVCPQQKTSNGLGSSNLVCKSPRETKWNPSTWVLCYRCSTVCLSLCSSRDLSEPDMKMEVERAADGHNFSSVWPGLLTQWDGLCENKWLWV